MVSDHCDAGLADQYRHGPRSLGHERGRVSVYLCEYFCKFTRECPVFPYVPVHIVQRITSAAFNYQRILDLLDLLLLRFRLINSISSKDGVPEACFLLVDSGNDSTR